MRRWAKDLGSNRFPGHLTPPASASPPSSTERIRGSAKLPSANSRSSPTPPIICGMREPEGEHTDFARSARDLVAMGFDKRDATHPVYCIDTPPPRNDQAPGSWISRE
jgi:hypothetical protein